MDEILKKKTIHTCRFTSEEKKRFQGQWHLTLNGNFEQVQFLPLVTFWPLLGSLPLNKCGFTSYDILAFFGPSPSLLTFHNVNYNPEP